MMKKRCLLPAGILLSFCFLAHGWSAETSKEKEPVTLEPVVVTATRTEIPIHQVSSSLTVITAEDITSQAPSSITEILRNVPGLKVTQVGGPGAHTMTIRGAKSSQVLFLLDGQPVTDPSSVGNDLNTFLGHLLPDDVERIEIVRGTQSTLYGSDAIGGVVNIITKKGIGKPRHSLFFEGGSENSFRETLSSSGKLKDRIGYSFTYARQDTDGIDDHDEYKNNTLSGKLDIDLRNDLQLTLQTRYLDTLQDLDDFYSRRFRNYDDPTYIRESQALNWGATLLHNPISWWEHKLSYSEVDTHRSYHDDPNPGFDVPFSSYRGFYQGKTRNIDWQHNFSYQDINIFTAGLEYEEQWASTRYEDFPWGAYIDRMHQKTRNLGYYFQNQLRLWDRLFLTLGLRIDDNDDFGTDYNPKASIAYLIPKSGTKLKGNYGSGFKAPALFQLYSQYGDPGLKPEESDSFDVGIEQALYVGDSQYNESGTLLNDAYTKADLVFSYDLPRGLQLYLRCDNLFDRDIMENGFQGPPSWVYGGIRARF